MARHNPDITEEFQRLKRPLRLTRAGLLLERLLQAFWPFLSLAGLLLCAGLFGAAAVIPAGWWPWVAGGLGLGLVLTLAGGILNYRPSSREEAFERMDAPLHGQPIAALRDRLALGVREDTARRIWRAHLASMQDRLGEVRAVAPRPDLARRDPYALRLLALLAVVMGLGFGSFARLADTALAGDSPAALAGGPAWEGWVEPPGYTGKPALYLADLGDDPVTIPVGSRVTLRLYGEAGALAVSETISAEPGSEMTAESLSFDMVRSGSVVIAGPNGRSWAFDALGDIPPRIAPEGELEARLSGEWRQPWAAGDDYGVTTGFARIELDLAGVGRRHGLAAAPEPRPAIELDLPLPFTGDRREIEGILEEYLVKHAWAGLPVDLTLGANDAAMQVGYSEPEAIVLPARRFFDPVAAALIEQRRDLLWTRENSERISQILRAVAYNPGEEFDRETDVLKLRQIIRRLENFYGLDRLSPSLQDDLAEALWALAIAIEEGNLADALERLRRAEERLEQAMRDGAGQDEIDELMREFREALRDYMRQLAEQAPEGDQQQGDQQMQEMTGEQLDQLLDRLQELMEQGRMAEAQQLMEMLRQMLENMQVSRGQQGQQSPGQQALDGLAETLRDQQGLSDDTFQDLQEGFDQPGQQGQQGQQGDQPGQNGQRPGDQPGGQFGLADRQQGLGNQLGQQTQNLPGGAGEGVRRSLDEAGRAMDRAEDALREGDLPGALDEQADAMEAMREGMREMAQEMAQQQQGQQGQAVGQNDTRGTRDPLGRDTSDGQEVGTDREMLQGQDVYRRAEELLGELRRRSGELERPELELDYLKRLLERF